MAGTRRVTALRTLWDLVRGSSRPGLPGVGGQLAALPRMLLAGFTGRYPYLAKGRLALSLLALLYLLSPVDAVPEAVLGVFGLGDDALVAAWVVGAVLGEVQAFLKWEGDGRPGSPRRTVVGEVVRG